MTGCCAPPFGLKCGPPRENSCSAAGLPWKQGGRGLPAPEGHLLRFYSTEVEAHLHLRIMERPFRVDQKAMMVRLIRAETETRRTLGEIVALFLAGVPLVVGMSALGGYFIARRSLAPVAVMAERARRITAESLSERLPVNDPHDEPGRLATVFNETLQRLENSFAELKRFAADASHEIRTPLTALRAVGEVALRNGGDPALLRDAIGSMIEEAHRLGDLIDGLLVLARADSGALSFARANIVVRDLLAEVREQLQILAEEKQQRIQLSGDPHATVRADRQLLRQVMVNVLHNAIRYSPAETVIVLDATQEDDWVHLRCVDEGPGIEPEHRTKIFERFYRIDKARSREVGGSGLGLAIAKWLVERQGGSIAVEGRAGAGSIFCITLPTA